MQTVTIGNRNAGQSMGSVFIGEHSGYDDKASNAPQGLGNNYVTSVGFQSDATGWGSIAIGSNATAKNLQMTDKYVVSIKDDEDHEKNNVHEIEEKPEISGASVALGYSAQAQNGNIAIGAYSEATTDLSADTSDKARSYLTDKTATSYVSVGKNDVQRRISNVADGAADSDVATIAQLKAATGSGFHFYGTKDTDVQATDIQKDTDINKDVDLNNYNGGGAAGEKTVAIGSKVVVTGDRSNSVGYANTVKGTLSDVYGNGNTIAKDTHNAVVLGNSNKVGSNSVAIGTWNKEKATNSVFIGGNDVSTTKPDSGSSGSPFTGWEAGHMNPDGTWITDDGGDIRVSDSGEVGNGEDLGAKKNNTDGNTGWNDNDASVAAKAADFGFSVPGGSTDTSGSTGSTGTTTDETIDKVTVVGKDADASGVGSTSLGYGAKSNNGNIAIGYNSQATTAASTKVGYLTNSTAPKSYVSVGDGKENSDTQYRRITNVADGSDAQDAVTVAQLTEVSRFLSVKSGWGINIDKTNTISLKHNLGTGYNDNEAQGMIIGGLVEERDADKQYGASDANSVILGAGKGLASGKSSVVVGGLDNVAAGASSVVAGGDNNDAIGNQSSVFGGRDNTATGIASTAGGGIMNAAIGQQSAVLGGSNNYVLGANATAIGGLGRDYDNGKVVYDSAVRGSSSVGIAGGSTGADATGALAAGHQAVVTTANGTAIGYQATTDEANTIAFGHDVGDVSGYTINWKQLPKGQTNADGTTNDYTQAPESVAENTYTTAAYNRLVKVADGKDDHDVVVMEQLKDYTKTDASNIGANLKGADGKNAASPDKIKENEKAWGIALGTGDINTPSGMLVTDTALHNELRPENGNYVKANQTTAQNLTALDTQAGMNTTAITNLKNLSNITDAGKTVIKDMAKGAVKVVQGKNTTVTEGSEGDAKTYAVNVDDSAIKGAVQGDLDKKANVDATNIQGENLTKWQAALGTGAVTSGNTGLMTGGAVYNEVRPTTDGTYVKSTSTTAANLTSLDTQVTTNTGDIATNKTDIKNLKDLSNITDAGKTVIKDMAKGAVKVVQGKNTTVTEGSEGDAKTYAVNVDDSAIKGAVQGDLDKKANVDATNIQGENLTKWQAALGTGAVTSGNTGLMTGGAVYNEVRPTDGTYVKSTNTTATNLKNIDTQVATNTGDIAKNKTDIANNKTAIDNITKSISDLGGNAVQYDADSNKQKVTLKGDGGTTITNVKDGALSEKSTDAVNGKQLFNEQQAREAADKAINDKIGSLDKNGNYIQKDGSISSNLSTLDNKVKENADHIAQNTNDIKSLKDSSSTISKEIETKAGKDLDNITDKGKQVIKDTMKADMDKKANVDASNIETSKWADKLGTGKVAEGDKNLINGDTVHNAIHEAEGRNPVQSNGQTITIGSKDTATKIDVSGKDGKGNTTGRVITGVVSDANDPNSATNVGYVNGLTAANTQQIYRDMNNAYSRLDTNINRAVAGSNALAALHPLDFDPADKASFAVGYGHYHNANAAAVGAFYQPNANTMVNMGISLGNGDPGFNAGVSFKIGKGSTYNGVSKTEMAQTIHDQAAEISTIKANDAAKDKRIDALEKENQEMKKQIQEILARLNG